MHRISLLLLISVIFWLHNQAFAASIAPLPAGSTVAILPIGGDIEKTTVKSEAITLIMEAFSALSYLPIGPDQITEELKILGQNSCKVLRSCNQSGVLSSLGVDAVVSIAMWKDENGKKPGQVIIKVTRRENFGLGEALIGKGDLKSALSTAITRALEETLVRHQVFVRIEAMQKNTRIKVDHEFVGIAPLQVAVPPGKRVVTATAEGYQTESQMLDVADDGEAEIVHKINLTKIDSEYGPTASSQNGMNPTKVDAIDPPPSVWNHLIASGLYTASAILLIPSLYTAIKHGDCYEIDSFGRCNRHEFGLQSTLMMTCGFLTLGGGLAFSLLTPIESEETVRVSVAPNAVRLSARY